MYITQMYNRTPALQTYKTKQVLTLESRSIELEMSTRKTKVMEMTHGTNYSKALSSLTIRTHSD